MTKFTPLYVHKESTLSALFLTGSRFSKLPRGYHGAPACQIWRQSANVRSNDDDNGI